MTIEPIKIEGTKMSYNTRTRTYMCEANASSLARAYRDAKRKTRKTFGDSASWVGADPATRQEWLDKGIPHLTRQAKELSRKMQHDIDLPTPGRTIGYAVAGGAVSVPRVLAGNPRAFMRPVVTQDRTSPVKVFACMQSSGSIPARDVAARAIAIGAFAMALAQTRPVELYGYAYSKTNCKESVLLVSFGLTPVNWGTVVSVFHPAFRRDCGFRLTSASVGDTEVGGMGWGNQMDTDVLPFNRETDIIFGRMHGSDDSVYQPTEWIRRQLEQLKK